MEPAQKAVLDTIQEYGGKLARSGNHFVYKFPDGKTFTMPSTPSDHRAWLNCYADLKRVLGIQREKKEPVERERIRKPGLQDKSSHLADLPDSSHVKIADVSAAFKSLLEKFEADKPRVHRTRRTPTERHGEVRKVPPNVLNEVNYITKLWGEEVGQKYLQDYLETKGFGLRNALIKKKEAGEVNNMADYIELALQNAKENLEHLRTEVAALEQKKNQISVVEEFISTLEMTSEAAKKAGPALRGILPTQTVSAITRERKQGGNRRRLRPNIQKEIGEEAIKLYGDAPFKAIELWKELVARPDWDGLNKTSVYSSLAQHSKNTATKKALFERVGEATYKKVVQTETKVA